jgi:hypothetical protein
MKYVNLPGNFKRMFLVAATVCCCTFCALGQTAAKPAAPAKPAVAAPRTAASILDNFFKKYKDSSDVAIDYLFATNKYFTNASGIATLKVKLDSLRISLGDYVGHELILQKSASPSLILYTYLVKHEIQPVRFTFMFYKPHSDWVLYRFKFDEAMDVELEEAGKINNKRP